MSVRQQAFALSLFLLIDLAQASLLVPNSSFEDSLDGSRAAAWQLWEGEPGKSEMSLVPDAANGKKALRIANGTTKSANLTVPGGVPCKPETTYTLTVYARTEGEADIALTLQARDASGNIITHTVGGRTALPGRIPKWQRFTYTATTPAKTAFLSPHLINHGGTVLWDAVQVDEGKTAQPFVPTPHPTLVPAGAPTEGNLIPNPAFEEGGEGASGWAATPGGRLDAKVGHTGRSLRISQGEKTVAWRSEAFALDTGRDYVLSAWVRSEALDKGVGEFHVECLGPWGAVTGMIGKGAAYREAAGVFVSGTESWRQRVARVGAEDLPPGTVAGRAVCSIRPYGKSTDAAAWFDDVSCVPAPLTVRMRLLAAGHEEPNFLADLGQPVKLSFALYAPGHAGKSHSFDVAVHDFFGKRVRRVSPTASLDASGRGTLNVGLDAFDVTGHFTVDIAMNEEGQQAKSFTFGIVSPEICTQEQVPDSPYGICHVRQEWGVPLAQRVGFKWTRGGTSAHWGGVERKKGEFDFTRVEKWRELYADHGLMKLDTFSSIPGWAQQDLGGFVVVRGGRSRRSQGGSSLPRDIADWQNYVRTSARELGSFGGAWEIWNEADIPGFWQDTDENYLKLLKASYPVIKATTPQFPVLMTGITGRFSMPDVTTVDKQSGREVNGRRFVERVLSEGKDSFDILNFHSYGGAAMLETRLKLMRELATKHGIGDRPMWITETGAATHQGGRGYTEHAQAQLYCQTHVLARAYGAEKVFWHCFYDWGRDITYHEHNFGLVHYDRTPKPALLAQAALAQHFGRPEFVAERSLGKGIRAFAFTRGDQPVTVIWANKEQTLLVGTDGTPTVRDMMGAPRPVASIGRAAALKIGPDPLFVLDATVRGALDPLLVPATTETTPGSRETLRLAWNNPTNEPFAAHVTFQAPAGWIVSPDSVDLALKTGQRRKQDLTVTIPADQSPGSGTITASLQSPGTSLDLTAARVRIGMPMAPARAPKLDGDLSDWSGPVVHLGRAQCASGVVDGDDDLSADVRLAWSVEGLWIAAHVRDQVVSNPNRIERPWVGDALEVFIDARPEDRGKADSTGVRQYFLVPATESYPQANWTLGSGMEALDGPIAVASQRTEDGYTLEAVLPWPPGFQAQTGSAVNVNLALDDLDEAEGAENVNADLRREAQLVWSGDSSVYRDASQFVPARFMGKPVPTEVARLSHLVNGSLDADIDADGTLAKPDGWTRLQAWGKDDGQTLWDGKGGVDGTPALAIRGVTNRLAWQSVGRPVQTGVTEYIVTGKVRTQGFPESTKATVSLGFYDATTKWVGTPHVPGEPSATGTIGWTEFTFRVPVDRIPAKAATWRVVCYVDQPAPGGTVWFDDLSVTTRTAAAQTGP